MDMQLLRTLTLPSMALLMTAGCASGPPFIDQMQPEAVSMATQRGQLDMSCPAATSEVLSRQTVAPPGQAWLHAEYTIRVSGCGQRLTYVVVCPQDGASCFADASPPGIQR